MWKRVIATFTLTIIIFASAMTLTARADERLSQIQTALDSTVISGFSQSDFTFSPHRNASTTFSAFERGRDFFQRQRNDSSLLPIPPTSLTDSFGGLESFAILEPLPSVIVDGSPLEIQVPVQNSMNVDSESGVNLTMSEGASMIEASRAGDGFIMQPVQNVLPPTPDSQIQFAQASEIQPAPEPSILALGGLAFGLIALFRASVKAKKVA